MSASPDVLVIDDVDDQRELLRTLFTRAGCDVRTAAGTDAAEPLLVEKAPDIAVVDLLLRGRDDGWRAMDRVRALAPGARIVICSVLDPAQFPTADAHLPKPFTAAQVRRVLDQLKPSR